MKSEYRMTGKETSVQAIWLQCLGAGKYILKRDGGGKFRHYEHAQVLNPDGDQIGSATRIYSDGWAIHTGPFGGYVPDNQIHFV